MKTKIVIATVFTVALLCSIAWVRTSSSWLSAKHKNYIIYFSKEDKTYLPNYTQYVDIGIKQINEFTEKGAIKKFSVYVHPSRESMDTQWGKDWNMPGFKSECWMVASGVGLKLDILSPTKWGTQACEHDYNNKKATQQLISHELFHVYHGQLNESPDFSKIDTLDWFVEGFATYASGQCDSVRMKEVKNAIWFNQTPESLADFWTGKLKYGLSGSMVQFIDYKYGRKKLLSLLLFNKKVDVLNALKINERDLIQEWKVYMKK